MNIKVLEAFLLDKVKGKGEIGTKIDEVTTMVTENIKGFNPETIQGDIASAINNLLKQGQLVVNEAGELIGAHA